MKLKLAIAISILTPLPVLAHGFNTIQAMVVEVQPYYEYREVQVLQEQCFEQRVPLYTQRGPSGGDIVAGAIIGGIIGNQFGNGSGNDVATALGAIIGAESASRSNNQIAGYDYQVVCEKFYTTETQPILTHYLVTYQIGNQYRTFDTTKEFHVGQRITIKQ